MIWRIMTCMGSSPISCVTETNLTPFFASFLERWLGDSRLDHLLKLGPPVVGGGCPRLNISLNKLIAPRLAVGFSLHLLVRDRDIMLGLPRRGDAQVKGGMERDGPLRRVHGPDS